MINRKSIIGVVARREW